MQHQKTHYKYLTFIIMLFMTVKLTTVILIYKIIEIGPFTATASTLIMPLWFILGDLITEVYGYRVARHAIWMAIICQFVFAALCVIALGFNSPPDWITGQEAYDQVLGNLPRVTMASFLAILGGAFFNAYALSKWKILLKGKYFWLRSFGASVIGELFFTIIAYSIEFIGVVPMSKLLELMLISFVAKLIFTPIFVIPSMFAAFALKRIEGTDAHDYNVNFNPFKIGMEDDPIVSDVNKSAVPN